MKREDSLDRVTTTNPLLTSCAEETRAALFEQGHVLSFDRNTLLFREGQPGGVVLFPLRGTLQLSKTAMHGRRQILCRMSPHACSPVCLLMMGRQHLADVHALEPGQLLVLTGQEFKELAQRDAQICEAGWQSVSDCLAHFSGMVENLSFHKVAERVALALLEDTENDGDLIRRTQAEMAAEVGSTREVVARCLAGLQTARAIRLGRGRVTVMNRAKLMQGLHDASD